MISGAMAMGPTDLGNQKLVTNSADLSSAEDTDKPLTHATCSMATRSSTLKTAFLRSIRRHYSVATTMQSSGRSGTRSGMVDAHSDFLNVVF